MARRKTPVPGEAPETGVEPSVTPVEAAALGVATALAPGEPDPLPEPDPGPAPQETRPEAPAAPRPPGIFAPLLGGVLAAVGGFALAYFDVFDLTPAPADPAPAIAEALAPLDQRLTDALAAALAEQAALTDEVAALTARLAALEAAPLPEVPDLSRLDALDARLTAIEALPAGDGAASTAALAAQIAALERKLADRPAIDQTEVDAALARLAEAEAEAEARAREASAAAAAAARAAAIEALERAILDGAPFEPELAAVGDPALSAALGAMAATGVATLGALQADFPDAARAVLDLSRQDHAGQGWGARALDFLADQTGARSVTPRAGDTPDAILSRAEAALADGRLPEAITELDALDPGLRASLADWIARAEARASALAALGVP
jgi:hypothetical protein